MKRVAIAVALLISGCGSGSAASTQDAAKYVKHNVGADHAACVEGATDREFDCDYSGVPYDAMDPAASLDGGSGTMKVRASKDGKQFVTIR